MTGLHSEVNLGMVQMAMGPDREDNVARAVEMIGEASAKGSDVVCLPELFNSMYFPQSEASAAKPESVPGPTSRALSRAASASNVVLVGGSLYERAGTKSYNTSLLFNQRGRVIGKYRKVHVPQDSHYFEKNYFASGNGYGVFNTNFGKVAPLICFDQWYPEAARICRLKGAEILLYPTAIGWVKGIDPMEGDWQQAWEAVQRGHAISNSVVVCAVNRVGVEGDMTFLVGSFVCDQFGKVLFRAGDREGVFVVKCNLSLGEEVEEGWGFLRNRKPTTYGRLID
jgi:agmatine deiminase